MPQASKLKCQNLFEVAINFFFDQDDFFEILLKAFGNRNNEKIQKSLIKLYGITKCIRLHCALKWVNYLSGWPIKKTIQFSTEN